MVFVVCTGGSTTGIGADFGLPASDRKSRSAAREAFANEEFDVSCTAAEIED
jgi:hypothetical protein